ncbi:hypothetical protein B0T17DRAFT_531332 [Bombardia bombarda]|uniref:Secreted protein n=1 Tax=Bombardia bombarda TaxID=252184 RepID=A0AA39X0Z0_9PEZI|nr:hypothetical protein B0T17DRAFT_531332 [Bombardia bombarda]
MGPLTHLTVLLAAVYPALVAAQQPRIASISYSGNGCPRDPKFSGDLNDPTLTFNNFAASYPGTNQTLNCEAHIQTTGGSGWQLALKDNYVKSHVVLSPGTCLDFYTTVFYSASAAKTATAKGRLSNKAGASTIDQTVTLHNTVSPVWSPCSDSSGSIGILNINFRGALTGDGSKAYFEALSENLDFEWKQC